MFFLRFLYPIICLLITITTLGRLSRRYFCENTPFTWLAFIVLALNALAVLFYSILCSSINIFCVYRFSLYALSFSIPIFPILISLSLRLTVEYNQRSKFKKFFKSKNLIYLGIQVISCLEVFVLSLLIYLKPASIHNLHPLTYTSKTLSVIWGWAIDSPYILLINLMSLIAINFIFIGVLFIRQRTSVKEARSNLPRYIAFSLILNLISLLNDIIFPLIGIYFLPPTMPLSFMILLILALKVVSKIPQTSILPQIFSLKIFDTLEDAIAFVDLDFKIIYANKFFSILFEQDVLNKYIEDIFPEKFDLDRLKNDFVSMIQVSTSKKKYLSMKYTIQKDNFGDLIGGVIILQDYSNLMLDTMKLSYEAKNINKIFFEKNKQLIRHNRVLKAQLNRRNYLQEEYTHLLRFDNLTQVYNRNYFFNILEKTIKEGKNNFSVFSIDINNFKYINDLKGHWVGDLVLIELAKTIKDFLGTDGVLARADSDNFLLLHNYIASSEEALIFSRILSNLITDIKTIKDMDIYISISVGICFYETGMLAEDIINNAELANLQASFETDTKYIIFTSDISKSISERFQLISEMKKSSERLEFIPYYQPQVRVSKDGSQKIYAYEALARWQHPKRGLLSPFFFIEVAESSGLIVDISYSILRQACIFINELIEQGFDNFKISVNLSAKQLNSEGFIKIISDIFEETQVKTSYLEFEITETELLVYNKRMLSKCIELKKLGISISIDDFGVAFASFNYIKNLPIDKMKIDKSFVDQIGKDKRTEQILYVILEFAKVCGIEVVVEGVEYKEQLDFLLEQSSSIIIQGFYFYQAMPAKQIFEKKILPQYDAKASEEN